ncbi:LOW QUALITY PROTEIN: hypothetical protein Cgig2_001708 [Carnegiea gigantea]|uniref:Reverse transcriptase zinc-binding domain-containing protein n=1 Tax=Carnegiea gigantea TaxID=171969 RepID=A0A9Q1GJY3_9CARY|nr:LOW QUALITY PROTEIN: hypothetical protein Cgig2_001708 [Carnegiea gigantea]
MVLDSIISICRNFLWGGTEDFTRVPHISWATTCKAKKHGGLGIKDFTAWNKATIAKLVWATANKKDSRWVKWVHGRYIRNKEWWDYSPPPDSSWTWKKICVTKDIFKAGCITPRDWKLQGKNIFNVSSGYQWLMGGSNVTWGKTIWSRASIPRHAFISWVFVQNRLPTKARLNRFIPQYDQQCTLCSNAVEDSTHLFLECSYATEVWDSVELWWPFCFRNSLQLRAYQLLYLGAKALKLISTSLMPFLPQEFTSSGTRGITTYSRIKGSRRPELVCMIKEQIRQRILYIGIISCNYSNHIDFLL